MKPARLRTLDVLFASCHIPLAGAARNSNCSSKSIKKSHLKWRGGSRISKSNASLTRKTNQQQTRKNKIKPTVIFVSSDHYKLIFWDVRTNKEFQGFFAFIFAIVVVPCFSPCFDEGSIATFRSSSSSERAVLSVCPSSVCRLRSSDSENWQVLSVPYKWDVVY